MEQKGCHGPHGTLLANIGEQTDLMAFLTPFFIAR